MMDLSNFLYFGIRRGTKPALFLLTAVFLLKAFTTLVQSMVRVFKLEHLGMMK